MDSITSLVLLIAVVSMLAAWCAGGRQFTHGDGNAKAHYRRNGRVRVGVDVKQHLLSSEMILSASLTLVAFFWNQFAVLRREQDVDFLTQPELIAMRRRLAEGMDTMANAAVNKIEFPVIDRDFLLNTSLLAHPRYGEFARNAVDHYQELELVVSRLKVLA